MPPKHPYLPKGCGNCEFRKERNLADPNNPMCQACDTIGELKNKDHIQKAYAQASDFDEKSKAIAEELGVNVTDVNLKKEARIIEKAVKDYNGNIADVKDIVRNTFVCPKEKMKEVEDAIAKEFEVTRITRHNTKEGYTGTLFNVKYNGIVMECQVNTPQMLFAKDDSYKFVLDKNTIAKLEQAAKEMGLEPGKGHGFYEKVRELDKKLDKELIESIRKESKEYYQKIRSIEIDTPQK